MNSTRASQTPEPTPPNPEAFFAAIVNSSSDAIISQTLEGTITSWNKGAERVFGYTAREAVGQHIRLILPPDRAEDEPAILALLQAGQAIDHFEAVRRRKDGSLVDISLNISPIVDAQGRVIGASKIARDITPLKREQERHRITLASIGDAVISTDAQGRVTFMNATAEGLTGWRAPDAIGRPLEAIFDIVHEGDRKPVASPVAIALRDGRVVELANHTILIAKDRSERPIADSAAPIRDSQGNITGVVLVFRDVSNWRESEIAAARLAAIIEGSDDAIVSKNLSGIVTSWNPAAERIFGYTAEEMIGQSITKVIPRDRLDEEQQILSRLQHGERVTHFHTIRQRKDGRLIHVSLTISPIRDKEGTIVGASKIARDVTEIYLAQQKLQSHAAELEAKVQERTAKLQETVTELESFSYSLSHDLRAPLRAIQSYAELIAEEQGAMIPDARDMLQKIITSANRMDRLIRDVLNFARVARTAIELAPVDVDALVQDILRERPELQRVNLKVDHPLLAVVGHDASLTQCLTNLIDNAIKFVAPGVTPNIRVYTESHGERARICVRDNGIGIDAEGQKQLFGIFQRLQNAKSYQGTGVGLAIVRRAAERMHGTVGVQSAPGLGSTFWIELPKP